MDVTSFPSNPGLAGWNQLLGKRTACPLLDADLTADVLVIGAGFAGLAAAERLRQLDPNAKITILEAGEIGEGPSGRNSGFMIDLPHDLSSQNYGGGAQKDRHQTLENRAAIDFCATLAQNYGMDRETFDLAGKINGAATRKGDQHNQNYAAHLDDLGEAYQMLDGQQMFETTGTHYYRSGLFTPGTAMIQPAKFIREFAQGLLNRGISIFEKSAVRSLRSAQSWHAQTDHGSICAPKVILAVNGHVQSFGHFNGQLMHVYTYGSMTRALSNQECARLGGSQTWGITPADPLGTSVRRISGVGGDRILVRNRFTYDPKMRVPGNRLNRIAKDHDRAFAARFPMLNNVEMEYRWGGQLCLSRNSEPAFGEFEPGLFVAACQNGLGTTKGTLAGMLAAEAAVGHESALLTQFRAKPKPQKLPPSVLTTPIARAIIRRGEFAARAEL